MINTGSSMVNQIFLNRMIISILAVVMTASRAIGEPELASTLSPRSNPDELVGPESYPTEERFVSLEKRSALQDLAVQEGRHEPSNIGGGGFAPVIGMVSVGEDKVVPLSDEYETDLDDLAADEYKRDPSRYAFGLGKRGLGGDQSRYSFGIGKRLPEVNRFFSSGSNKRLPSRFQFGLGKKSRYSFGLGKRDLYEYMKRRYNFGIGKRSMAQRYAFGLGK